MKLIVGLGNPGKKYALTRHNLGFLVLDEIARRLGASWSVHKKANAEVIETNHEGEKLILAKPQTFMNLSGQSIGSLISTFNVEAEDVWIVHDDVDLPFGMLRVRHAGSAGGHNGIKSIIDTLGTQSFTRFRMGVSETPANIALEDWVLSKFTPTEQEALSGILGRAAEKILATTQSGTESVTENLS